MKTKSDATTLATALQQATLKAAKLRRIVEAEEKLAHAAKVRFKGAKKTWKLARKTAKRSARKLQQAEELLAKLSKRLKRATTKTQPKARTKVVAPKPAAPARSKPRPARKTSPPLLPITTATATTSEETSSIPSAALIQS